jgi:hypothetical protein
MMANRSARTAFVSGVIAGLGSAALVWFGATRWQQAHAPVPPPVQVVSTFTRDAPAPEPLASAAAEARPAPVTPPVAAPEPPPKGQRYAAEYPVFEKLVDRPLSSEPHQLLGAWDEDEHSATPGARRAYVLAVSPDQSDASLEALARDVRARNLDALVLDVRIYDDAGAAIGPRVMDSGASARQHLVAVVQRNPAASLDAIRVRGRALDP